MRRAFEKIAGKQVSNDELQQKLDELNNKFQEDIKRSKRMINRNTHEGGEEIIRIIEQMSEIQKAQNSNGRNRY